MEIFQLILIIIAIYAIYWLIVNVIAPIVGFLLASSLAVGIGYAFCISIYGFVKSLVKHKNPYKTYIDKNNDAPVGVRRSYFFGPGYHQLYDTVRDAFSEQIKRLKALSAWKGKYTSSPWYLSMWVWISYIVACICAFVFGFTWMAVFSLILLSTIFIGMCVFYIFFTSLWGADRITLATKSIQSRCANCKQASIVPLFVCPNCGSEHKKLTPGPYGIFHRNCTCGRQLPTTFFNGRSKLKASCPSCATELVVSDAIQFGIQLVGGVGSGKTSYIAAFFHLYLERLKSLSHLTYEKFPADAFVKLEHWYQQGLSSSTTEANANMYNILHKRAEETPYQLAIYDIAGEAFSDWSHGIQQQQFKYCEGIIFVIDPTATPDNAIATVSSFINEFKVLKGKSSTEMSNIPIAIVISKADEFKLEIGLSLIKMRYESQHNDYLDTKGRSSFELTRNGLCQNFLKKHGFENVLNLIDGEFNDAQYFPISAMGHTAISGQPYEPWGVMEPIMWILEHTDAWFAKQ